MNKLPRRREKGRKKRGKRGEKREERSTTPRPLLSPSSLLPSFILYLSLCLSHSFDIEGSDVVILLLSAVFVCALAAHDQEVVLPFHYHIIFVDSCSSLVKSLLSWATSTKIVWQLMTLVTQLMTNNYITLATLIWCASSSYCHTHEYC